MATISSTLALAANVTAFDCTELWTLDSNGTYYCPYVYATDELRLRCPNLLVGHHPRDKLEHFLSPKVCTPVHYVADDVFHYYSPTRLLYLAMRVCESLAEEVSLEDISHSCETLGRIQRCDVSSFDRICLLH